MAGFQSSLARTVIAELLKALTPDDYFLILQVHHHYIIITSSLYYHHYIMQYSNSALHHHYIIQVGETTRPIGCFTDRARATPENVLVNSLFVCLFVCLCVVSSEFHRPWRR